MNPWDGFFLGLIIGVAFAALLLVLNRNRRGLDVADAGDDDFATEAPTRRYVVVFGDNAIARERELDAVLAREREQCERELANAWHLAESRMVELRRARANMADAQVYISELERLAPAAELLELDRKRSNVHAQEDAKRDNPVVYSSHVGVAL